MLAEERFGKIIRLVEEQKSITVPELMDLLHVSESTVRMDLKELDAKGRLIKVHGGAMARVNSYNLRDDDVDYRKARNMEEKILVARYAASLIEADDFVFLDAGTTTELMVDYVEEKSAVFVTNGILHAKKLAEAGITVYILGGEYKGLTEATVGPEAIRSLEKYNFTKVFMGTNGISREKGFSTPDVNEAIVKQCAMSHGSRKYVLADASKFSQVSCVTFAEFEDAVVLTTGLKDVDYRKCRNIREVMEG